MRSPPLPLVAPALALALLLQACGGASDAPCILVVTLDTTRADAVGFAGGPAGITPALDALAAESVVFERARTVAPITLPAHSSLFTGLYPTRHGVRLNGTHALPSAANTLAERARDAGYATAAFVAAAVLDDNFGLNQGFETYGAPLRPETNLGPHFAERPASAVVEDARAWLRKWNGRRPFFLWVHLFDPHNPYEPNTRFYIQGGLDSYRGEVAQADHAVGTLLDDLRERGVFDRTCIVVVGDHGEGLSEHEEVTHGALCYESTLRVPLLVRFPGGRRGGERSRDVVSVVDVYPTLLDVLGASPEPVDGVSLHDASPPPDRGVYFESFYGFYHYGWGPLAGWADREGKFIAGPEPRFFGPDDLEETAPLAPSDGQLAPRIEEYRARIAEKLAATALPADSAGPVDAGLLSDLRQLGYAASDATRSDSEWPDPLSETDLPDPAAGMREVLALNVGIHFGQEGQHAEAIEVLEGILDDNPRHAYALLELAYNLGKLDRFEEAIEVVKRFFALGWESAVAHLNIGSSYDRSGQPEAALVHMRRALELDPGYRQARANIIQVLEKRGLVEEANRHRAILNGKPILNGSR